MAQPHRDVAVTAGHIAPSMEHPANAANLLSKAAFVCVGHRSLGPFSLSCYARS